MEGRWKALFEEEKGKDYFKELVQYVKQERAEHNIYPEPKNVMEALKATPFEKVKVVILGQDPYHGPGQAHGLAFSSLKGTPPSLEIIYDEIIRSHLEIPFPGDYGNGNLTSWATQGVLLLNTCFTVRQGNAKSHFDKGWEKFTDVLIDALLLEKEKVVWLLWGNTAKQAVSGKKSASGEHFLLTSVHPAAQAYNKKNAFVGNNHFVKCNDKLREWDIGPISWDQSEEDKYWKTYTEYKKWRDTENNGNPLVYMDPVEQRWNYDNKGKPVRKDLILFPL